MATSKRPSVLLVDDQVGLVRPVGMKLEDVGLQSVVRHPGDVSLDDLERADLVSIDYKIDTWPDRDRHSIVGLSPLDGASLASVFRSHLRASGHDSPTGFVVLTGQIDLMAAPLAGPAHPYRIAHAYDLEWVFLKSEQSGGAGLIILAKAIRSVGDAWSSACGLGDLVGILGVRKSDRVRSQYISDVEAAQPPIHKCSPLDSVHIVRWLLHRVLPFPTFLWSLPWLAARLRMAVGPLEKVLRGKNRLAKALRKLEYSGPLADLNGRRWWRSGVEAWLWEETGGRSASPEVVRERVSALARHKFESLGDERPVVCIDSRLSPLRELSAVSVAVRSQPEGWPAFADQAWIRIEDAQSDGALRSLVVHDDLEKLNGA